MSFKAIFVCAPTFSCPLLTDAPLSGPRRTQLRRTPSMPSPRRASRRSSTSFPLVPRAPSLHAVPPLPLVWRLRRVSTVSVSARGASRRHRWPLSGPRKSA